MKKLTFGIFIYISIIAILLYWSFQQSVEHTTKELNYTPVPIESRGYVKKTGIEYHIYPIPEITPGAMNPAVTQENLKDTICKTGYTKTVRPSTSVTNKIKKESMKQYGYTDSMSNYELDHFYPITDSGHPSSPQNLWPQVWHLEVDGYDVGARTKDRLEVAYNKLLCSGKVKLESVPLCFNEWVSCYKQFVGPLPKYDEKKLGGIDDEEAIQ